MALSVSALRETADVAAAAAVRAGHLLREWNRDELIVQKKAGGLSKASQVVTQADLMSQALIIDMLRPSCETHDFGLLTEEAADDGGRFEKAFFWCVDPLDGTLPFVERGAGYAVSIALVSRGGVPVVGVVYNPTDDVLYRAVRGGGAFRNEVPLHQSESTIPKSSVLSFFIDRSFLIHPKFEGTCERLAAAAAKLGLGALRVVEGQGAALNGCAVADTAPACYFKYPRPEPSGGSLWDFAASACIATESGAWVSDMRGAPLHLNRREGTFMNHTGVLYASSANLARRIQEIYEAS